jgi:hypothetical protein
MDEPRWSNVQRARGAYNSGAIDLEAGPLEAFFEVAERLAPTFGGTALFPSHQRHPDPDDP